MNDLRRFALLLALVLGLGCLTGCESEKSATPPPPPAGSAPPAPSTTDKGKGGPISNPAYDSARGGSTPKKF
jgi:hypothetical protein